jgi:hypothetical protein
MARIPAAPLVLFAALCAVPVAPAAAQGTNPLTKTDLIQLITSRNRTQASVAELVRRNCLTFTPTARDLSDLRVAGADSSVLLAVRSCESQLGRLRLVAPPRVRATAGQEVTIAVRALRGARPERAVTVILRGASAIPGGSSQDPGAVTDAQGVARLRLLTGMQPGTYTLEAASSDGGARAATIQLVTVAAGAGMLAAVRPTVVRLRQGSRSGAALQVAVQDASGRPVPGVRLELDGVTAQLDTKPQAVTDPQGVATFVIPPGSVRHGGQVAVFYAGTRLAAFDVLLEAVMLSGFRTQFVSGPLRRDQRRRHARRGPHRFDRHDPHRGDAG